MAKLRIERGERAPYEIELGAEDFDIGRGPANALHFRDPWLSRAHARIRWQGGRHCLEDLASRNGTYLNGSPLTAPVPLTHGDCIVLGEIELRYLERDSGAVAERGAAAPFAGDSTVVLATDELVFDRYREPPSSAGGALVEESLLPALNAAAAALMSHFPLDRLVERILELVMHAVDAERGAVLLRARGGDRKPEVVAFHGFASDGEIQISHTIVDKVLLRKEAILTLDAQTDERFDEALSLQLAGVRSLICAPLWTHRGVTGMVYLDHRIAGRAFSARDLKLVGLIASMAAVKIDNAYLLEEQIDKRRMEEQLAVGAKIQRSLLPAKSPRLAGYDIFGATRPCFEVSGDYFDFIPLAEHRLAVVIADIAGKGVGAALLMAVLRASLRALLQTSPEPAELVQRVNRALLESSPANRFATLFYGELNTRDHELEYVSGGHNPALLSAGGTIEELMPTGPIVGLMSRATYTSRRVNLPAGSTLLLYTDGVTELMAPSREEFGTERLIEVLQTHPQSGSVALLRAIEERMKAFARASRFDDDSTAVVIRRLAGTP